MSGVSDKADRISNCWVSISGSLKLTEGRLLLQEQTRCERMKLLSGEGEGGVCACKWRAAAAVGTGSSQGSMDSPAMQTPGPSTKS